MSGIRRGDPSVPNVSLNQITEQLTLGVDRVMSEGSLDDKDLAALAIKQSRGDLIEAIFLLRATELLLKDLVIANLLIQLICYVLDVSQQHLKTYQVVKN